MRALVTGAAGFIGSHLAGRLVVDGHSVLGVDTFTPFYDAATKWRNLANVQDHRAFSLVRADLVTADLDALLHGVDVVFHLAAQPGVRSSWGAGFADYVRLNIGLTQRLLEACRHRELTRFVNSSSSSVYGDAVRSPTRESDRTRPVSPYGVTKLAAEHLATLYGSVFGVNTVSLRYFTVYGPRQRPDMAMSRLIRSAMFGERFPLYGDGSQGRDFTYVDDVVDAMLLAASAPVPPGSVMNVGGGSVVTMQEVMTIVADLVGSSIPVERRPAAPGDPHRTSADIGLAAALIGWEPRTAITDGLARQIDAARVCAESRQYA